MRIILSIALIAGLVLWIASLQRRLHAAQMRGDMYRDISTRLDQQLAELAIQER